VQNFTSISTKTANRARSGGTSSHIRGAQTAKQQLQAHEASNGGKAGRLRGAYLNCKSARFEMQIAETIRQNAVNNFRLPLDIYVSSR
jgi:flagellar hook-basal body complex protein FliE